MGDEHFHTAFCVLLLLSKPIDWRTFCACTDESREGEREQREKSLSCSASTWFIFYGAELAPRRAWPRNALKTHIFNFTFTFTMLSSDCFCLCVCVFWGFLCSRFLLKCSLWRCRCCCCLNSTLWVLKTADRPHWQIDECLCCLLPACLPVYAAPLTLSPTLFLPFSPSHSLSVCLAVCLSRCLALCCFSPLTIYICSLSILMKIFWKCAIFLLRHTIYARNGRRKKNGKKNAKKIAECSWQKNVHEWRSCSWESLTICDQFGSEWLRSLTACRQLRSHFYGLARGRGGGE